MAESGRAQADRQADRPRSGKPEQVAGDLHHGPGVSQPGQGGGGDRRVPEVEDRFPDAKEAIEYFTRKEISLPEVTTIKPGEAAEVELKFRNVASADVKVYRIDLMKFSLLKRNLQGITQINLAGIRPLVEKTVKLGDGKDYRDRTEKLQLALKEEGAYLVVRGATICTRAGWCW